jgi:hypothetical protein
LAPQAPRDFFFKTMSIPSDANPFKISGELPIIEACLDLIRWFVPLLQRLSADIEY